MGRQSVKVLLLGDNEQGSSHLAWHLEHHGCLCWFAKSTEEGLNLFDTYKFQLVLSTKPLRQADAIVARFGESNCDVFCCYPADDSCWWLPLTTHGEKSQGGPALRPSEFVSALDQIVKDLETNAMAELQPSLPSNRMRVIRQDGATADLHSPQ